MPNVWFDTSYNTFPKSTVNVANQSGNIIHPTEKNVEMIEWFIKISSNENDIILDPFVGSGITAIASKNLNRKYIGFEIEEKYVSLANSRLKI